MSVPRLFTRTLLAPRVFVRPLSATPAVRTAPQPDTDYSALTARDLRTLLKERKLKVHGSKSQLINRLLAAEKRAADAAPRPAKSTAPPTPSAAAAEPAPAKQQSAGQSYADAKARSKADVNANSEAAPKPTEKPVEKPAEKSAEKPAAPAPPPKSTAPPTPSATAASTPAEPTPAKPVSPAPTYAESRATAAPTPTVSATPTPAPLRVPKPHELHPTSPSATPVPYLPDNHLAPYHRGTLSGGSAPVSSRNRAINVVDATAAGRVQGGAEGTEPTWQGVVQAWKAGREQKVERTGTIFTQEEIDFTEGKQRGLKLGVVAAGTWVLLGEGVMRAAGII